MEYRRYKRSNSFSGKFFMYWVLVLIVAVPLFAFAYVNILHFGREYILMLFRFIIGENPSGGASRLGGYLLLVFVLLAGYTGAFFGSALNYALRLGKVRKQSLAIICGVVSSVILKYVMWLFYIPLVYVNIYKDVNFNWIDSALHPFQYIGEIMTRGSWTFGTEPLGSDSMLIVWILEALILLIPCFIQTSGQSLEPFCEETGEWFSKKKITRKYSIPESFTQAAFCSLLKENPFEACAILADSDYINKDNSVTVLLYKLPEVNFGYLTVENKSKQRNKSGTEKGTATLVRNMYIDSKTADLFC